MLNGIMLNVANNPFMLSVIMLSAVMLGVVAPINKLERLSLFRIVSNEENSIKKRHTSST